MKRFSLSIITGGAAMLLMAGLAVAQPTTATPSAPRERMHKLPFQQLGLSDQQREQIHQTMLDTRKKNIDIEAKQKVAGIELHELMSADTPDQGKINAKISEVSKWHETLLRNRVESALAVQKVLTPEQRKKMKELRPMLREHFRGGFRDDDDGPRMMRRGGFGLRPGMGMPPEPPEPDDEEF